MPESIVTILDVVISGLLMGGVYAVIAVGFSLQYGVARVLNISHGEFIMIGAYITWTLYTLFGINPLVSIVIASPIIFIIGFLLHRTMFTRLRIKAESFGAFEGSSLLVTFGLLFIIQNVAVLIWGGMIQGYNYLTFSINWGGLAFPANRLTAFIAAVVIGLVFYLFLARTRLGKAIRAAAQDQVTAGIVGVNVNLVLAICFGLGAAMACLAGTLISMSYTITPFMGLEYTVIAIIVVVLGGLGNIVGSFIGGFILGLVGSIVLYFDPGLSLVAYYALFVLVLLVKPTGILGR
jgi:branched-chain amino acid transport system permease protein